MYEPVALAVRTLQLVRVVQRRRGIRPDPGDQGGRHPLALEVLEQLPGVDAVDVLHRDEVVGLDLSEVVDVDDVRMAELSREPGLAEEHLHEVGRVDEVGQDPLHRDAAIEALEPALLREEHLGHSSARDAPQEHVVAEPNAGIGWHANILASNAPAVRASDHASRRPRRSRWTLDAIRARAPVRNACIG